MKQSTKLLSFILAILVAFSCLSVIGSAKLEKGDIAYDCIDDADLTYAQVSCHYLKNTPLFIVS